MDADTSLSSKTATTSQPRASLSSAAVGLLAVDPQRCAVVGTDSGVEHGSSCLGFLTVGGHAGPPGQSGWGARCCPTHGPAYPIGNMSPVVFLILPVTVLFAVFPGFTFFRFTL